MTSSLSFNSQLENTKTDSLHLVFLPGLHGTDELFCALNSAISVLLEVRIPSEVEISKTTVSYPTDIPQSYSSLLKWLVLKLALESEENNDNIILIAESFSSPLVMMLADAYPEQIKAVILGAGFCASPVSSYLSLLPLTLIFSITPPRFATRYFLTGSASSDLLVEHVRDVISNTHVKIFSERLRTVLSLAENLPPTIQLPTMLLQASADALIPEDAQNLLEHHLPHANIQRIDAPHFIFQSEPKICAQHIVTFIKSVL